MKCKKAKKVVIVGYTVYPRDEIRTVIKNSLAMEDRPWSPKDRRVKLTYTIEDYPTRKKR